MKFKIGETVIAITSSKNEQSQQRTRGYTYTVHDVKECFKCKLELISIGEKTESPNLTCACGQQLATRGRGWTRVEHFVSAKHIDKEMLAAAEREDYETAALLRDLMKPSRFGTWIKVKEKTVNSYRQYRQQ